MRIFINSFNVINIVKKFKIYVTVALLNNMTHVKAIIILQLWVSL